MMGFGGRKGQDAGCRPSSKKHGERSWAMAACLAAGAGFWALAPGPALAQSDYPSPSPEPSSPLSDQAQINKAAAEFFFGPLINSSTGPTQFGRWRSDRERLQAQLEMERRRLEEVEEQTDNVAEAIREVNERMYRRGREIYGELELDELEQLEELTLDDDERASLSSLNSQLRDLFDEAQSIRDRIEALEEQLSDSAIPELAPVVVLAFAGDALSGGGKASFSEPSVSLKAVAGNNRTQFRLSGNVSSLSDSSDADREGHVSHLSLSAAHQLTSRFVLSGGVTLRDSRYDIDTVQSSNDYTGFAISASGSYQLDQNIALFGGASVERGSFDPTLGTTTGSYDATSATLVAGVGGLYGANGLVLQPQAMVSYVHYDLEEYTASDGTVVSGQSDGTGSINAALTVSKPLAGNGGLESWQPYATVRILHNFEDSGPITLGPGVMFEDGQTFGTLGVGAMFRFDNGGGAGLGVSYTDAFDGDLGALTIGAMLSLPFN